MWCIGQVGFTVTRAHRPAVVGPVAHDVQPVRRHRAGRRDAGAAATWARASRPRGRSASISSATRCCWDSSSPTSSWCPSVVPAAGPAPQSDAADARPGAALRAGRGARRWCVWLARDTAWRDTFARLAIGAAVGFFLRLVTSGAISSGRYHEGSFYDLAWIVPFVCYLWAAPRRRVLGRCRTRCRARGGWQAALLSARPVFLIPLIGFGLLRLQPIGDPGDSVRLLLTVAGDGGGSRRPDAAAVGAERGAPARRRARAA